MSQSKTCPKCNVDRPLDRFYKYRGQCKNCLTEWQKGYYRKHPNRRRQELYNWRFSRYGITEERFDELLDEQAGGCAICGKSEPTGKRKTLVIDHCHKTGTVRGLLCQQCNSAIGFLRDDPEAALAAVAYLKKARCAPGG